MADVRDGADVGEGHQRMGRRLDMHELRVGTDGLADVIGIGGVDVGELNAVTNDHLAKEARGAAVDVVATNDVVACVQHRHHGGDGRHAAGEDVGAGATFEGGKVNFKGVARGVGDAGVLPAAVLLDTLELVSGRKVDGNIDGAGEGIGFLSVVDGAG